MVKSNNGKETEVDSQGENQGPIENSYRRRIKLRV